MEYLLNMPVNELVTSRVKKLNAERRESGVHVALRPHWEVYGDCQLLKLLSIVCLLGPFHGP